MDYEDEHRRKLLDAYGRQYNDRVDSHARPDSLGAASKFSPEIIHAQLETARQERMLNPDAPVWPIIRGGTAGPALSDDDIRSLGVNPAGPTDTVWINPADHSIKATTLDPNGFVNALNLFPFFSPFCTVSMVGLSGSGSADFELSLIDESASKLLTWICHWTYFVDGTSLPLVRDVSFNYTQPATPPDPITDFHGIFLEMKNIVTGAGTLQSGTAGLWVPGINSVFSGGPTPSPVMRLFPL